MLACQTNSSFPMESIEEEPCQCHQFQSVPGGQWSQCIIESSIASQSSQSSLQPTSQSQFCGIGKRFRRLDCLDANNQITDPKWVPFLYSMGPGIEPSTLHRLPIFLSNRTYFLAALLCSGMLLTSDSFPSLNDIKWKHSNGTTGTS